MHTLLQDLRQSLRALVRQPLFAGITVASLALGIGISTVIFSVVYGLLLRPLPYPHPAELVHVGMGNLTLSDGEAFGGLTPEALRALSHDPRAGVVAAAGFGYNYANLTGVPNPTQLTVGLVTADYFRVYGLPPARGRFFDGSDAAATAAPTVVLSDHFWRTQFHADESLIGRTITLGDQVRTVVGVMGPDFKDLNDGCEVWLPLVEGSPELAPGTTRRYITTARLADGSEHGRAALRAYLATLSSQLAQEDPARYKDWHLDMHPLAGGLLIGHTAERALWLLFGAVACVVLVTCANVANLQLVRAAARRRETGVRLALGAGRGRIIRHALTESLVLAALGAGLGILLAAWGVDAVTALLPAGYSPLQDGIALNGPVLAFAAATAGLAGILTGLWPAWSASRQDPAGSLSASAGRGASEGPGAGRLRAALVVAEVALALVLLAGAGLMGRSLLAALRTDAGMRLERTLMINLSLSPARAADNAQAAEYYRRLLEAVNAVPGVAGTALTTTAPFSWYETFSFLRPGQSADAPEAPGQSAAFDTINPECFATLGIPVRRGRVFTAHDGIGAPPCLVVNEEFARRFFPAGDALGSRALSPRGTAYEIIGIVGNVRRGGLDQDAPAQVYFSYLRTPDAFATLYVHAAGTLAAESLTRPVEKAIWQLDGDQPIGRVTTLEQAARGSVAYSRLYTTLFAVFAGLTLGLAVLGVYGTVAYSVGLRTREIGIRMALGAGRGDVVRLVLRQGVWLVAVGIALGAGTVLALAHLMQSLLYGVRPTDPVTLAATATLLGGASLLASWLPARRAARIDPLRALREE